MEQDRLLLKVEVAAERLSIGRSKAWELITTGQLRTVRIGRAVRVPAAEVARFVRERVNEPMKTNADRHPGGDEAG